MKKSIACILLTLVICCALLPLTAFASGDVPQAVLDLRKSVVRVLCESSDGTYTGSGFAIGRDEPIKYIVTNLHVVSPNPNGITILRENKREIPAKVFLQVDNADLCVLLLDEPLYGVPPVELQDGKDAAAGQAVYALGFPGAADIISDALSGKPEDVTITDGIVSAVKSFTYIEKGTPIDLLQVNAALNHGNSGGPLVDEKGAVLGVNSLGISDAQNINGAVSILELISALKDRGVVYRTSESSPAAFPIMTVIIIAGAVVLAAGIALFVILMVRRSKKRAMPKAILVPAVSMDVTLPEYVKQWGGKLPYAMAERVLAPVLWRVAEQHRAGRVHGDICAEAITVNSTSNQARLLAPEASAGAKIVLRPGFSAPEQYRADGRIGPWSDVYSICAVFYFVITGKAPLGVMERMALGGIGAIGFGEAAIDQTHGSALLSGLALDAAARPQNAVELTNTLGIAPAPALPEPAVATAVPAIAAAAPLAKVAKPPKKRLKTGKKLLIAGLATLFVLFAGAGGFYLYTDGEYNKAIECIGKQDYTGGVDDLTHVLRIFKDAEKWMNYACAGAALQRDDFNSARNGFTGLKDFNDSGKMLNEVDYLEAHYFLASRRYEDAKNAFIKLGAYKGAKSMIQETDYKKAEYLLSTKKYEEAIKTFTELSKVNYKESKSMIDETVYVWSLDLINTEKYLEAYEKLKTISKYKDSSTYLKRISDALYSLAVDLYRNRNYTAAKEAFENVGNVYDSNKYISLIQAHQIDISDAMSDYAGTKALYNKLLSYGTFEDAASLCTSDLFLLLRLEGGWADSKFKNAMGVSYTNTGWQLSFLFYGEKKPIKLCSFRVEDGSIYLDASTRFIEFTINSRNSIKVTFIGWGSFSMTRFSE